jgi:hypothetical protein
VSVCTVCDGVREAAGGGWVGGRGGVQSDDPRPPRRQHWGGTPCLVSSEISRQSQQRGDAASGGEGRMPHRGGSDGVSCARCDRRQVSSSAGELSGRSVDDMKYGLGLGGCALQPPPREENLSRGKKPEFEDGCRRYGDESAGWDEGGKGGGGEVPPGVDSGL